MLTSRLHLGGQPSLHCTSLKEVTLPAPSCRSTTKAFAELDRADLRPPWPNVRRAADLWFHPLPAVSIEVDSTNPNYASVDGARDHHTRCIPLGRTWGCRDGTVTIGRGGLRGGQAGASDLPGARLSRWIAGVRSLSVTALSPPDAFETMGSRPSGTCRLARLNLSTEGPHSAPDNNASKTPGPDGTGCRRSTKAHSRRSPPALSRYRIQCGASVNRRSAQTGL